MLAVGIGKGIVWLLDKLGVDLEVGASREKVWRPDGEARGVAVPLVVWHRWIAEVVEFFAWVVAMHVDVLAVHDAAEVVGGVFEAPEHVVWVDDEPDFVAKPPPGIPAARVVGVAVGGDAVEVKDFDDGALRVLVLRRNVEVAIGTAGYDEEVGFPGRDDKRARDMTAGVHAGNDGALVRCLA